MNTVLLIVLICLSLKREIVLLLFTFPVWLVTKVKRKYNGSMPRGNRYFSFFDDILLFWIGQIPFHVVRMFYYRHVFGASIGKNVVIHKGCEIRNPIGLSIGDGSIIGDDAILDAREGLTIGSNVNLSSGVSIWTLQHDYRSPDFSCNPEHYGPVIIEDRVWIGPGVIVLPSITIHEGSVIAAGAVATTHVNAFSLYGGIPAKYICDRPNNLKYTFSGTHRPFI